MTFVRKQKQQLDELIKIPAKAEERSMIQISFWTQDSNIKTGTIRNPGQNSQLIHCTNPQSMRFLRTFALRTFARKFSTLIFFSENFTDDDELVMSEM